MSNETDVIREALAAAYEQGCIDTHKSIHNEPELALMQVEDAEFGEAATDYATSALPEIAQALAAHDAGPWKGSDDVDFLVRSLSQAGEGEAGAVDAQLELENQARCWEEYGRKGHALAVYLNRRCTGPDEHFRTDVFDAVQAFLSPFPTPATPPIQAAGVGDITAILAVKKALEPFLRHYPPSTRDNRLCEAAVAVNAAFALLPQPDQSPSPALDVEGDQEAAFRDWFDNRRDAELEAITEAYPPVAVWKERLAFRAGWDSSPSPVAAPARWRPIATAPKDGTVFIGWHPHWDFGQAACWERPDCDDGSHSGCPNAWVYADWLQHEQDWDGVDLTHWLPLPAPPSDGSQASSPRDGEGEASAEATELKDHSNA